ncbi:MAG: PhzF family phenazine biosynthesis protein [candidate division WOR-3 bacterium]|nr:MAG: PhzF family phenazine biosynthesis protein [candidate division WOR-3 bacterium]
MKKECVFIDVFTDTAFAGNQLAVFPDGSGLTVDQMQRLANEINYSETTFIFESERSESDFDIRIFTPGSELPFAGHPTLGTAYAIMDLFDLGKSGSDSLTLGTKVGAISLQKQGRILWMTQNQPEFFDQHTDMERIAGLVDLSPDDISTDLPVEEVSTGNRVLIIPVKALNAIGRARGNATNLSGYLAKDVVGPYLFSLETTRADTAVHTRFFAPHLGIMEDPATGSAAGPLVGYFLKHNVFGTRFEVENEQGVEMGRRSRILMRGVLEGAEYTIQIGGECAYAGRGEFEI